MKKFTILLLTIIIGCVVKPNAQKTKPTVYPTNTALSSSSNSIPTEVLVSSVVTPNVITSTIALAQSSSLVISPSPASQSSIPTRIEDIYDNDFYTFPEELKFNNGTNKDFYDGSIIVIIDTSLMRNAIADDQERNRYPTKVMILKESYDALTELERVSLKNEYPNYTIFDRSVSLKGYDVVNGALSGNIVSWLFNSSTLAFVFSRGIFYNLNNPSLDKSLYPDIFKPNTDQNYNNVYVDSMYSKNIFELYKNLKISNRNNVMRKSIKRIKVGSINDLSYLSVLFKLSVSNTNTNLFEKFYFDKVYGYSTNNLLSSVNNSYGLSDPNIGGLVSSTWLLTTLSNTTSGQNFLSNILY